MSREKAEGETPPAWKGEKELGPLRIDKQITNIKIEYLNTEFLSSFELRFQFDKYAIGNSIKVKLTNHNEIPSIPQ